MKIKTKFLLFLILFILSIFLLIYLCNITYTLFLNKIYIENSFNQENIFKINKIVFFSSASGDISTNTNNTSTLRNIIQYTDIAIFIDNSSSELSYKNTLKSVSIEDIKFINMPKIGSPKLYYKNLSSFASSNFDDKYILNNSLNFTITQDDNADLSSPILYNNCANPIVISYKNENLITDHTISNKDSISYDGSLLKDCNIILSNLKCSFSFYIVIENNLGHKYRCPIYLTIPLSNGTSSIYNGSFYYTYNPDYYFYLYT